LKQKKEKEVLIRILKKTETLHRAIFKFFSTQQIKAIFRQIFFSYTTLLRDHILTTLAPLIISQEAKERLKASVVFFTTKLSQLKDIEPVHPASLEDLFLCIENIPIKNNTNIKNISSNNNSIGSGSAPVATTNVQGLPPSPAKKKPNTFVTTPNEKPEKDKDAISAKKVITFVEGIFSSNTNN